MEKIQEEILSVIEKNLKKTEYDLIKKIFSENEAFKRNVERLETIREELEIKTKENIEEIEEQKKSIRSLEKDSERCKELEELQANSELKLKDTILKGKEECLDKIFALTKIAFKTPEKIKQFSVPVGQNMNGNNQYLQPTTSTEEINYDNQ